MRTHCALTTYPLSLTFQHKLERVVDEPIKFLQLGGLREKPLLELWAFLRACRPNIFFIPVEDHQAAILLPILQLIAKVAMPKQLIVVHPDLRFETIQLNQVVTSCLKLMSTTIALNLYYRYSRPKLIRLLSLPRQIGHDRDVIKDGSCLFGMTSQAISETWHSAITQEIPRFARDDVQAETKNVLYLNTNLWFGVKAGGSVGHIAGVVNALAKKGLAIDYAAVEHSSLLTQSVQFLQLPNLNRFGVPAVLNYYSYSKQVHDDLCSHKKKDMGLYLSAHVDV